jgi:hypothetical protein
MLSMPAQMTAPDPHLIVLRGPTRPEIEPNLQRASEAWHPTKSVFDHPKLV